MLRMPVLSSLSAEPTVDCDAVVEALIREHLTKKQYTTTLAAFKQEEVSSSASCSPVVHLLNPKHPQTYV